jgi:NAD(P)-dependent dehydrogenase (short-subunit alcohol dehydrogenase family)
VVLACRSSSKGEAMVKQLSQEAAAAGRDPPQLEVNLLDLASLRSVRDFVERWQQRPLHVLVNNAGMFNMGGEARLHQLCSLTT